MPPEPNDQQGNDQGEKPPITFGDVRKRIIGHRMYEGDFEGAETIEDTVTRASDLNAELIASLPPSLQDDLKPFVVAEREEAERQEKERLAHDRDAAKAALKKKLAEERAEEERVAAEKRREQELLDEIAAEEAAKGNGQPTPSPDGQLTTIEQSLEVIHATTKLDDGRVVKLHTDAEMDEAARKGIEAARTLESSSATFNPNREDLAARAKARLDKMKEAK